MKYLWLLVFVVLYVGFYMTLFLAFSDFEFIGWLWAVGGTFTLTALTFSFIKEYFL